MTELQIVRTRHPPEAYLDQLALLIQTESPASTLDDVRRRLEGLPTHDRLFLALEGEKLIGYAHLSISHDLLLEQSLELRSIIVVAARRRQGVGRTLMTAAETWAFQGGRARVVVHADVVRSEALAFFTALDYEQSSTAQEYLRDLDATRRAEAPTKPQ